MKERINVMDGWTDGRTNGRMHRGGKEGWMDGWMDGWMGNEWGVYEANFFLYLAFSGYRDSR